jgi:hypothetical protein
MSRAPHDSITRALPGDEHAALRRTLRQRIRRVIEAIPEGWEVRIDSDGGKLHPRGSLAQVVRLEDIVRE